MYFDPSRDYENKDYTHIMNILDDALQGFSIRGGHMQIRKQRSKKMENYKIRLITNLIQKVGKQPISMILIQVVGERPQIMKLIKEDGELSKKKKKKMKLMKI